MNNGQTNTTLAALRILGTVGEPINPEAWKWYYKVIGKERLAIIDTWWQTETGGFMIAPLSGLELTPLKPGSATLPLPAINADIYDDKGQPVAAGSQRFSRCEVSLAWNAADTVEGS